MIERIVSRAALASTLAIANPVAADAAEVLLTGNYEAGTPFSIDFTSTDLGPGTWHFRLDSSTPLDFLVGNIIVSETVTECIDPDPCEANTYETVFFDVAGSTPLLATLTVDPIRVDSFPDATFTYEQHCCRFEIFQSGAVPDAAGTFTLTAQAVPEPASWALMLAGFGVAGAAMRRRGRLQLAQS